MEQLIETGSAHTGRVSAPSFLRSPAAWLLHYNLGRGFWIFFAAAFFFDFGFSVYFFLFNLFLVDLHLNERAIGLVGGALTLGGVAGTLPTGWLARKAGLRPLLVACMTLAPVLGLLRTLFPAEPAQIALAFLAGIAMCLWTVNFLPTLAGLTTPENRASSFSLIFSVSIGTSALGGLACGYLPQILRWAGHPMQDGGVKRLILQASCAIALLGLAPILMLRIPKPEPEAQTTNDPAASGFRKPWKLHPFLLRFLPAMALWTAVIAAFTPFANVYLTRDLRVPLAAIGVIFSVSQLIQLFLGLLTPLMFRRLGLINGIVATQLATGLALTCLALTRNPPLAIALYLSLSATQWMSSPGLYNLLMSSIPASGRSSASALTMFSNSLLQSAATAAAGLLFVRFGYPPVLLGIALAALAAALLFKILCAPGSQPASS